MSGSRFSIVTRASVTFRVRLLANAARVVTRFLIASAAVHGTVGTMTNDTNSVPTPGGDSDQTRSVSLIDAEQMTALLLDAFNDTARGALKSWSRGQWRRSESIAALQDLLNWLGPIAASDTLGLWVSRRLASAAGLAMAVASRADDDDADDSEDVPMVADGAEVLSTQVIETDRVWMTLDDASRRRWRDRLPQRITAVAGSLSGDPSDSVVELASCTTTAAAAAIHPPGDGPNGPSIDALRTLAPICPACGTPSQLTQSTAGWAPVTGIDLEFEIAEIGGAVAAERGEVMCRECFGEFSEKEVIRASIVFGAAVASR
jgi:hypothetical protein